MDKIYLKCYCGKYISLVKLQICHERENPILVKSPKCHLISLFENTLKISPWLQNNILPYGQNFL